MEETPEDYEDVEMASNDSSVGDSDEDEPSTSGQDDDTHLEASCYRYFSSFFHEPLTEQEIQELISEFLEVESKAAEAQEALEKESLAKVENEVREELAQTLQGDELEAAVQDEITTLKEEWETVLDELETESAHLLEQLDGAGIELPSLYKMIESQAPDVCCTEAWKNRTHWVGSQVTTEVKSSVADAEKFLQDVRPVRRRHGKLLEEGASGFIQKKVVKVDEKIDSIATDWDSLNKLFSGSIPDGVSTFGSDHWASVYLANTPKEASMMGLKFPGVDEVEEIEDIDANSSDPFVALAIKTENELPLSEEQMKKYKKVKEDDDAKMEVQKLQHHLKKRRRRKRQKQSRGTIIGHSLSKCGSIIVKNQEHGENVAGDPIVTSCGILEKETLEDGHFDKEQLLSNGKLDSSVSTSTKIIGAKRPNEHGDLNENDKKIRTVGIDGDNVNNMNDGLAGGAIKVECQSAIQDLDQEYRCTACDKITPEIHSHPLLRVIVCKECKCMAEDKLRLKDPECYCGWCGQSEDLISCKSCKYFFCKNCITKNIGEECHPDSLARGWQCCCCLPSLLDRLTSELEKAVGSVDSMDTSSDSDSENSEADINVAISSKRRRKKKIRRILDDAELGEETKRKIAIEKERQEHLKSLKVQFSGKSEMTRPTTLCGILPEGATVEVLGDATTGYVVNVVREKGEEAVRIPPSISAKLKAHQVAGIRFMWENIIQSIGRVKSGDKGLGCILAHTMGLGKTFQVIAFLYTAMRSVDLGLKTALIVTPVNVLYNWRHEFMKWKPSEVKPIRVFMLEDVSRDRRGELLAKWRAKGGVFLIGYTAFRNLSFGNYVKDQNTAREISVALQEGPDILVCDEAHMIKNSKADTTQALKLVKCQRRIALTGSPLQNNLMEYYCKVFLAAAMSSKTGNFQNPIENGQHTNSTSDDVKIMNQRSHILYEELKGFVQRMDMDVVKKDLPPKTVFVITVKLSQLQRKLYKKFLEVHGFASDSIYNQRSKRSFFAGYQALAQIWNHPGILQLRKDKDYVSHEEVIENDENSSDENVDHNKILGEKPKNASGNLQGKNDYGFLVKGWWNELLREDDYKDPNYSGKMVLLLEILTMCSSVGDKALVFSQSIPTLDLIEFHLSRLPRRGKPGKFWRKEKDWYRLDGRTESSERQKLVERFNDPLNKRVKCTLISTRAGSLGINLHSANRVIIVDGSWNPTYDLQAIYRAWRYGQKKPVFAYRMMAHGTMEEKIYKRQVTKEGLAARVVDRQQVHRTISREEMLHLFEFGDEENPDTVNEDGAPGISVKHKVPLCNGSCPSDKVMESLLGNHHPSWIAHYHEHETLLQENEEEKLTKEEQDMAWEVYRRSLDWKEVQHNPVDESTLNQKPPLPKPAPLATQPSGRTLPVAAPQRSHTLHRPAGHEIPSSILRNREAQHKCTNLTHLQTLRSQGTKKGSTTVCGGCAKEIKWEDLNNNGKMAR
ncbi:Protein CHROMATIN REMODELING 20 [Linum perenne]